MQKSQILLFQLNEADGQIACLNAVSIDLNRSQCFLLRRIRCLIEQFNAFSHNFTLLLPGIRDANESLNLGLNKDFGEIYRARTVRSRPASLAWGRLSRRDLLTVPRQHVQISHTPPRYDSVSS